MFTGLIEATGKVRAVEARDGDTRLWIESAMLEMDDVRLGDSIACNGVCLTVVVMDTQVLAFDVSTETLACTTLSRWRIGTGVNLEKALRFGDRLGGHLVSGHVDGVGTVLSIATDARSLRWAFALPPKLSRYVAVKGSIAVDGVSLTVNAVGDAHFEVNLIPHTMAHTVFADTQVNAAVNIEIDLMARYAERLLMPV